MSKPSSSVSTRTSPTTAGSALSVLICSYDIAAEREVVLVDNSGVGLSTGTTPHTVKELARDALAFIGVLHLTSIDVLGFSLGGFVAQEVVLQRPRLVRRLILAGTGPEGGRDMHAWT